MIHVTCFRCRRRFELDPVWVGVELSKSKARRHKHYQAHCPGCQAINKISVLEMRKDLDAVGSEIEAALARQEATQTEANSGQS